MVKKRKDECLFCSSRSCHERMVSYADGGATYDEIACLAHTADLEKHSDETIPSIIRLLISSTGRLKRGEKFTPYEGVEEK